MKVNKEKKIRKNQEKQIKKITRRMETKNEMSHKNKIMKQSSFGLVLLNGISTLVGYLTPNLVFLEKLLLRKQIRIIYMPCTSTIMNYSMLKPVSFVCDSSANCWWVNIFIR